MPDAALPHLRLIGRLRPARAEVRNGDRGQAAAADQRRQKLERLVERDGFRFTGHWRRPAPSAMRGPART